MYHFRVWTTDEDNALLNMWKRGAPAMEIATALKRTAPSVYERVKLLNLPRRKGKGPRSEASAYRKTRTLDLLKPRGAKRNWSATAAMFALSDLFDRKAIS